MMKYKTMTILGLFFIVLAINISAYSDVMVDGSVTSIVNITGGSFGAGSELSNINDGDWDWNDPYDMYQSCELDEVYKSSVIDIHFNESKTLNRTVIYIDRGTCCGNWKGVKDELVIQYNDSGTWKNATNNSLGTQFIAGVSNTVQTISFDLDSDFNSTDWRIIGEYFDLSDLCDGHGSDLYRLHELQFWGESTSEPASSTLILLFSNESHPFGYKTLFDEGENFYSYISWNETEGDIPINDTMGACNITFDEGIYENATALNFTLCNTGCNHSTYTANYSLKENNDTGNVKLDTFHALICHAISSSKDLDVNVQCGGNDTDYAVDKNTFGLCNGGYFPVSFQFDECAGFKDVNITLSNLAPTNQRHILKEFAVDRTFNELIQTMSFNYTSELWYYPTYNGYYVDGLYNINATCVHHTVSDLDKSIIGSLTIVNAPPEINIIGFVIEGVLYNFNDSLNMTTFEFINGDHVVSFSIIDDDLTNYTIVLRNDTMIIYNQTCYSSIGHFNFSASLFYDFQNTYNFSITAQDNDNTTYSERLFNLTDSGIPTMTGDDDVSMIKGENYTFNLIALDEYVWSFELVCSNGHAYHESAIGLEEYHYTGSFIVQTDITCYFNVSDGHTANVMTALDIYSDKQTLTFNDLTLRAEQNITKITYEKKQDRYTFCYETSDKETELKIYIPESCVIAPRSKYKGHYVCLKENLAIDFEGLNAIKVMTEEYIIIDVSKTKSQDICFNSIVELNTLSGSFSIESYVPQGLFAYEVDTESIGSILLLFIFLFFYLALWVIAYTFGSKTFASFGFFWGIVTGFMMLSFNTFFTIMFILLNIILFIGVMKSLK